MEDSMDFFCDIINNPVKIIFSIDFKDGKYEITRPLKNSEYVCLEAVHPKYCSQCAYIPEVKRRMEQEISEFFKRKYLKME
ncbi:MAG TPA: hypothetical protein PK728_05580 [Bacillota bacterium]|nr:hypothetical protein [Bacillota bacterium]